MQYLQELIEKESTGTPKELARRLGISERMVYRYVDNLKIGGKLISFSRTKNSYIFSSLP